MNVKVKICGINREKDIRSAVEEGADALGFIVGFPDSPRNLSPERAYNLIKHIPSSVDSVIITPYDDPDRIRRLCRRLSPDALQLYCNYSPDSDALHELKDICLIRAISLQSKPTLNGLKNYLKGFDALHIDSSSNGKPGGTGKVHDWRLSATARQLIHPIPLILAGGLNEFNVCDAIRVVRPYAVDVSSGVESSPGVKDPEKIRRFIRIVKEAHS